MKAAIWKRRRFSELIETRKLVKVAKEGDLPIVLEDTVRQCENWIEIFHTTKWIEFMIYSFINFININWILAILSEHLSSTHSF